MNGYEIMAASYRQMVKQGRIDKETADKEIRIYDFLATCDSDDLCRMVDSSAFNDIIRAYLKMAVQSADIDEDAKEKVITGNIFKVSIIRKRALHIAASSIQSFK